MSVGQQSAAGAETMLQREIPEATVARLPVYFRALTDLRRAGLSTVSSSELAEAAGVNPAQLRKDLSCLGSYGVRGVGYDVANLADQIGAQIGTARRWPVVIVGMGNLGTALANYSQAPGRGFRLVAAVDRSAELVGRELPLRDGTAVAIRPVDELSQILADERVPRIAIGIIATPASEAQEICDVLVAGGIRSILNFAAAPLQVPDEVVVRSVDLGLELQILAYHAHHHLTAEPLTAAPSGLKAPSGFESPGPEPRPTSEQGRQAG